MILAEIARQFLQLHVGDIGEMSSCVAGID